MLILERFSMSRDLANASINAFSIDDYNPYPSFQPGQKEAITEILDLYQDGEKVIELNAPTASGKSLDLYVLGRILSQECELKKVIYTTPLVALVNQLEKNKKFSKMPVLKGKRNYPCSNFFDIMADDCPFDNWGEAMKQCWSDGNEGKPCCDCEYQKARLAFVNSHFGATTFARYVVDPACHLSCQALLIDESAGLETTLVNYSTFKIPEKINLSDLKNSLIAYQHELIIQIETLKEELKLARAEGMQLNELIARGRDTHKNSRLLRAVLKKISDTNQIKSRAEHDLAACGKAIYHIGEDHKYIIDRDRRFRLLEGKSEFKRLIEDLDLVILASGTPTSELYAEDFKVVKIQHPIAVNRRLIYYYPVGSMSYKERYETIPKMAAAIEKLHSKYRKKTMVHCGAYSIAKAISEAMSPNAREITILQEDPEERELYKNMFMGAKGESIFLSIRFTEGLDLKGPDYPMNIIAKVPLENIKDEYVAQRNQHDNYKRYNWFAAVDVMQGAGRCTRSPDDFSETWILDSYWKNFFSRNRKKFQPWFVAALNEGSI